MIAFYLDKRADKHGDCPIRVSTRAQDGRLLTSIGFSINPDNWDTDSQQVKPGTKKAPVANAKGIPAATINARIAAVRAAFALIEAQPGANTLEALQGALDGITGKAERAARKPSIARTKEPDLSPVLKAFEQFYREESARNQWAEGTLAKMQSFRRSLQDFNPRLSFADLNEKGITSI